MDITKQGFHPHSASVVGGVLGSLESMFSIYLICYNLVLIGDVCTKDVWFNDSLHGRTCLSKTASKAQTNVNTTYRLSTTKKSSKQGSVELHPARSSPPACTLRDQRYQPINTQHSRVHDASSKNEYKPHQVTPYPLSIFTYSRNERLIVYAPIHPTNNGIYMWITCCVWRLRNLTHHKLDCQG